MEMESKNVKINEVRPNFRNVNIIAKILSIGETREINTRSGTKKVAEATIGDETACALLSLWDDQIGQYHEGDVINIQNGYVSLVRGSIRLNIGKYGKMDVVDKTIENINTDENISDQIHEMERKPFRDRGFGSGKSYGRGKGGFGSKGRGRPRKRY